MTTSTSANRPGRPAAWNADQRHGRRLGDLDRASWPTPAARPPGRGVDQLRQRLLRPGPGRDPRRDRCLDRRGLDRLRGRRQHARRLDHARRAGSEASRTPTPGSDGLRARRSRASAQGALLSFDRQPEIIAWEARSSGRTRVSASGGIVQDGAVGFALENQTRPDYSPFFFGAGGQRLRRRPRAGPPVVRRPTSRSTRGTRHGSTRASRRTPNGCGASTRACSRRRTPGTT